MHDLFFSFSKAFWLIARPETWFGLLLAAAILALIGNRRRIGIAILVAELVLFVSLAAFPLGDLFLAPLENRFPTRPVAPAPAFIVVLGGAENAELSAATGMVNVNQAGERLLAAIELATTYPGARFVLSGGFARQPGAPAGSAEIMAQALTSAGIDPSRLLIEPTSRNTAENGSMVTRLLGAAATSAPMLLVTSAYHMPRSMAVFCAAGWTNITPYPVDHRTGAFSARSGWAFAANLEDLNVGVKEWVGLLAYRLTGRTRSLLQPSCLHGSG